MKVDCIIVGQGICGTFLSWQLQKAGRTFMVWDDGQPQTASKTAAGIINPVTGRRIVKTWMIDLLLPDACTSYQTLGREFGCSFIEEISTVDFFPTPQMRLAFTDRLGEEAQYLQLPENENMWRAVFNYDFGFGKINFCYLVDLPALLNAYRQKLIGSHQLRADRFRLENMFLRGKGIQMEDIEADYIIFCDGMGSVENPYFRQLPFAPNKGEALLVNIKDFPARQVFKRGISIVPWKEDIYWVGSSYEWKFDHALPTAGFRSRIEQQLSEWLKIPFEVVDHIAAIRPATIERRPFVGFHPVYPQVGILNGMGTKGCSLAPYFSKQLADWISSHTPILAQVDIHRYRQLLSQTTTGN